jgi:L-alanine-DL-glutamate epimerase-like enolase superfamily enzyme
MKSTDLRVRDIRISTEEHRYRTPIKFGGVALDRATLLNAAVTVETRAGLVATGLGSMPLGNIWAFPSRLPYETTLTAMRRVAERVAGIYAACRECGHPIDLTMWLEHDFFRTAEDVATELGLDEPIPRLATLVAASPFDAALHDAMGKAHGVSVYRTYGSDFMNHDLGHWLGGEFRGDTLVDVVDLDPKPAMPLYHLVGALDPLDPLDPLDIGDLVKPIGDGLPETLAEWIPHDGLTHLKIKLNGDNLAWDTNRVFEVDRVAETAQRKRGIERWHYSLDFNEKCPNVAYLLEFLRIVEERRPAAFGRIQYIEQPTSRNLRANRHDLHAASTLRPIVLDEGLLDLESLLLARDQGYTGAALKACKGQSQSLLMAAAARKFGMFLCVQDLTCPGASLIQSASLAAHVRGVAAIEANARQYCPAANAAWVERFPGIFRVRDGMLDTSMLTGPGLGT